MRGGGSGVGERLGRNDDLRWQPSGVNRVERDRLLQAARREHAEACGKPTAKGSPPRWRRGIAGAGRRASQGERGGVHQLGDISIYGQDKRARRQRPFGLATRARRVKNGEGSDPFWTAAAAGTKSRQRGERWSQPHERQQPKQSNPTTRRLAIINLALRGIEATAMRDSANLQREAILQSVSKAKDNFGPENADTLRRDLHPDLRADYVLANPPFNDSDTALRGSAFLHTGGKLQVMTERQDNFRKDDDVRWQFGVPPKGNANFAWVQHFIHHLAPQGMVIAGLKAETSTTTDHFAMSSEQHRN